MIQIFQMYRIIDRLFQMALDALLFLLSKIQ